MLSFIDLGVPAADDLRDPSIANQHRVRAEHLAAAAVEQLAAVNGGGGRLRDNRCRERGEEHEQQQCAHAWDPCGDARS